MADIKRQSGRIDFLATALDAIHHGAGTSGNTSMLRVQEITTEDGEEVRVPFISGNSFKHMIRDAGVQHALAAMGVAEGSLSKGVVDLLFSGGHLTKTSASINLSRARQIADLFPILGICGYSAGNYMAHSKIYVDNIHLVCQENSQRLSNAARETPQAALRASVFRGEDFGTRHEATRSPHVARLLTGEERLRIEGCVSELKDSKDNAKASDSSQMIYEFQVIKPGSLLYGGFNYRDLNGLELAALKAALSQACLGKVGDELVYYLGAKASIGLGRVSIKWSGSIRGIVAPTMTDDTSIVPTDGPQWDTAYTMHLQEHRNEILQALSEASG